MPPKISVVIPTYDRCDLLTKCLDSLEQQSQPAGEIEVIVVVDGSKDDTLDFLKKYSPPYLFKFLVQENRGFSASLQINCRSDSSF